MVGSAFVLNNGGIDPAFGASIQEFSAVLKGFLCEIRGCSPHYVLNTGSIMVGIILCIGFRGPVYDKSAFSFPIVVRYPGSFRCPHHTKLRYLVSIHITGHVKLTYIAPVDEILGFPHIHLCAVALRPCTPTCIVAAKDTKIRCYDIISFCLRIVSDIGISGTGGSQVGCQYRLTAVEGIPLLRIISSGYVKVNLLTVSVAVLNKVNHHVPVRILLAHCWFYRHIYFLSHLLSTDRDNGSKFSFQRFFSRSRLNHFCGQSVFSN